MDISIIIVSYNVRHFLLKCIESIYNSNHNLKIEIIVVDNASADGSISAVRSKFAGVKCFQNENNFGFSRANNIGIDVAQGQYVLILNPDTILQEDCLATSYQYMQNNENCGVLGVKMIDGGGHYLRESKRGMPDLWNSFCKFSGLTDLFPDSRILSGYYLGHLPKDEVNEVDVLCGAYMFFRKKVLLDCGKFDEDYFMYGEDIDLSLQVKKRNYKVIYLPSTRIIHFKGESTKKASFNYIKNFYQAMSIFVCKNQKGFSGLLLQAIISIAIFFSAIFAFIKNNIFSNFRLFTDIIFSFLAIEFTKNIWALYYFNNKNYFQNSHSFLQSAAVSLLLCISLWIFGQYDKNWKLKNQITGIAIGTIFVLTIFSLLPSSFRSSRAMILIGAVITYLTSIISKRIFFIFNKIFAKEKLIRNTIIISSKENAPGILELLSGKEVNKVLGIVSPVKSDDTYYLNDVSQLPEVIKSLKINQVVFSSKDMSYEEILDFMVFPENDVKYLITTSSDTIIESNASKAQGTLYNAESNYNLSSGVFRRLKRIFDILFCLLIVLFPVFVISRNAGILYKNLLNVIWGSKTWIGYSGNITELHLPIIKTGVFDIDCNYFRQNFVLSKDKFQLNQNYAEKYNLIFDLRILINHLF